MEFTFPSVLFLAYSNRIIDHKIRDEPAKTMEQNK
jgi:hypothetical protein